MAIEYSLRIEKVCGDEAGKVVEERRFMTKGSISAWYPSYEAARREYAEKASEGNGLEVRTVRVK